MALTGLKPTRRRPARRVCPVGRTFGEPTAYRVPYATLQPISTVRMIENGVVYPLTSIAKASSSSTTHSATRQRGLRVMPTAVMYAMTGAR